MAKKKGGKKKKKGGDASAVFYLLDEWSEISTLHNVMRQFLTIAEGAGLAAAGFPRQSTVKCLVNDAERLFANDKVPAGPGGAELRQFLSLSAELLSGAVKAASLAASDAMATAAPAALPTPPPTVPEARLAVTLLNSFDKDGGVSSCELTVVGDIVTHVATPKGGGQVRLGLRLRAQT